MKVCMEIAINLDATIEEAKERDKLECFNNNVLAEVYAKAWKRMFENVLSAQGVHEKGDVTSVDVNKVTLYDTGSVTQDGIYQFTADVKM